MIIIINIDNNNRNDHKAIEIKNKNTKILCEELLSRKIMDRGGEINYVKKRTVQEEFDYIYLRVKQPYYN